MSQRSQQSVEEYLRQSDTQERIWRKIQEARENVTVTISRAANLFGFSESKLREWEKRGLLQTERSLLSQDGKGSTGHRQYTANELDKLAIIRELIERGGYTPGEIPNNVDKLWNRITSTGLGTSTSPASLTPALIDARKEQPHLPIDRRIEETDRAEFWRYFVCQALRISLALICADIPDTLAGLVLPLEDRRLASTIHAPDDLPAAGLSLIGWVGGNRSFYTFLDDAPTFEYPSDFRLEKLTHASEHLPLGERVADNVLIVLQRRARPLSLSVELVTTVRRILDLLYSRVDNWQAAFNYERHDWLYQAHDLESASREFGDRIFNSLLERVIEIGGQTDDGRDRWNFCALLVPNDASLPIQQQVLTVGAQTRHSPYEIGVTTIRQAQTDSLSQKAFLSGQVISFPEILPGESMTTYIFPNSLSRGNRNAFSAAGNPIQAAVETDTRSAIAIPLLGESGVSIGVLYVAANETKAFSQADQRVLRVMARMVEELLLTSQVRRQAMNRPEDLITQPNIGDTTFQAFGSETDFLSEIEKLLGDIEKRKLTNAEAETVLSLIAIDIDKQSSIGAKYGNRVARNISHEMGVRIVGHTQISSRYAAGKLFHLSADRYCFVLSGMPLEETQNLARQLKNLLDGTYHILPLSATSGRQVPPENMLEISGVTTHMSVLSYNFGKLAELMRRYPVHESTRRVRALIVAGIEECLERGKREYKGNCIITWNPKIWNYERLA